MNSIEDLLEELTLQDFWYLKGSAIGFIDSTIINKYFPKSNITLEFDYNTEELIINDCISYSISIYYINKFLHLKKTQQENELIQDIINFCHTGK